MKIFATAFLLASTAFSASAFSAVSPPSNGIKAEAAEAVDKTLRGIDAEGSFDPTDGDNAALTRNNNDEVWNQQVSLVHSLAADKKVVGFDCHSKNYDEHTSNKKIFFRPDQM